MSNDFEQKWQLGYKIATSWLQHTLGAIREESAIRKASCRWCKAKLEVEAGKNSRSTLRGSALKLYCGYYRGGE